MKICSWSECENEFMELVSKNEPHKLAIIVFNPIKSNWTKFESKVNSDGSLVYDEKGNRIPDESKPIRYSMKSRCYLFSSSCKWFDNNCIGKSIYADCLDGTDQCLKLSNYYGDWKSDFCIIFDSNEERSKFIKEYIESEVLR